MTRILAATANPGKAREIREIMADLPVEVLTLADFPWLPTCEETEATFAANARLKARFYNRITGLPTLADDSGLVVDCLDGAPGVHSARYAGEGASDADRIAKLLAEMKARACADRAARFVCAVSFVDGGRERVAVEGRCEGEILPAPRGEGGFGYDPVFLVPATGKTFAELPSTEKHALSHRGQALARFREQLPGLLGDAPE